MVSVGPGSGRVTVACRILRRDEMTCWASAIWHQMSWVPLSGSRRSLNGQDFSESGGADWAQTSTSWPRLALARASSSVNVAIPPRTG